MTAETLPSLPVTQSEPETCAGPNCAVSSGSPSACANGYDLAFLDWFRSHGWQIHVTPSGVDVWSNDDTPCPFKVTRGMIDRLEWSRKIERIFPYGAGILDYVWALANTQGLVTPGTGHRDESAAASRRHQ